jgi:hypothetical protein
VVLVIAILEWLGDNVIPLVGLIATLALLAVTFWYAKTTKEMATIAKDTAAESVRAIEAAERSAQAALDAARVAQSRVNVDFVGRTIGLFTEGQHIPTVEIRSIGDPVVVQGVKVRRAIRATDSGELHPEPCMVNADLTVVGEVQLPTRLHQGERLHLSHPEMQHPLQDRVSRFLLDVEYTFGEDGGPGGTREMIISEPE